MYLQFQKGQTAVGRTLEQLLTLVGGTLFFLMLATPGTLRGAKSLLLGILLTALIVHIVVRRRIALHPAVMLSTLALTSIGAGLVIWGIAGGAPGALRMSTVYVLWPLAYLILLTGVATPTRLHFMCRILVYATIAIVAWTATYLLRSFGYLPEYLYLDLALRQNHSISASRIEISIAPLTSLLFLVPFLLAAVLTWPPGFLLRRAWLWTATVPAGLLVLVSGRRALVLVVAVSVPITLAMQMMLPASTRHVLRGTIRRRVFGLGILLLVALIGLQVAYGLTPGALWGDFQTGFQFSTDPVASMRKKQAQVLLDAWAGVPLFGAGHGAVAPAMVRTQEMPWAYELSYLALLFHAGLIGFAFYAAGALWVCWMLVRIIRSSRSLALLALPVSVGSLTFLIGNTTNPYLEKWDSLWVVFLPLAFINTFLLAQSPIHARLVSGDQPHHT